MDLWKTHPAFSAAAMDMCLLSSRVGAASNCRGRSVVMNWESRVHARDVPSLFLSLVLFTCGHYPRAPRKLFTTIHCRYISPLSDEVVNHHSRHQYHRNQHSDRRGENKKRKKNDQRERFEFTPWFVHTKTLSWKYVSWEVSISLSKLSSCIHANLNIVLVINRRLADRARRWHPVMSRKLHHLSADGSQSPSRGRHSI